MNRLLTRRLLVEVATFCVVAQGLAVLATTAVVIMGPASPLTVAGLLCVAVFTASLVVGYAHVIRMDIDGARESAERRLVRTIDERNERIAVLVREAERSRSSTSRRSAG